MDIKPVNPSIYPSPNPSGIKIAFNIGDSSTAKVREVSCTKCIHQEVCKYKQDFLDVCNAVSSIVVNRPCEDGKKVEMTPITNLDCLDDIYVCCRYYFKISTTKEN